MDVMTALPRDLGLIVQEYAIAAPFCFELDRYVFWFMQNARETYRWTKGRNWFTQWIQFYFRTILNPRYFRKEYPRGMGAITKANERYYYWKREYVKDKIIKRQHKWLADYVPCETVLLFDQLPFAELLECS
jgi:hypothetical protein